MSASEAFASSPPDPDPKSWVVLTATALQVDHLSVDDPEVMAAARRAAAGGQPLGPWLMHVLRTGAVALGAVGSGRDLAELHTAVRRTGEELDQALGRSSDALAEAVRHAVDPEHGPMAAAARQQIDRLSEGVARLVTGSDAVLPASVRASVSQVTAQALTEIQRVLAAQSSAVQQAITHDRASLTAGVQTLLGAHHEQLTTRLAALQAQISSSTTPAVRPSAVIGADHEQAVVDELCRIAQAGGDQSVPTGTVTGNDGSKVGDAVSEFGNPQGGASLGRLVCEAKDRSAPLSADKMLAELRAARSNRSSQAGLMVCASETMMPGRQGLLVLSDRDLAVVWREGMPTDVLRAAYLLLKLGVARSMHGQAGSVDLADLRRRSQQLLLTLRSFDTVERLAGTTGKNLTAMSQQLASLRANLTLELDELNAALRSTR